ncbi:hypothetical protein TRIUR3_28791 [Triticum urartu]|uniref:DUF7880 domain-containing protein n=1 Tax=Triticum urartu TaxID=4572 RepID=M7YY85_TRIUA|nr:hypothetical protein TRIUR3_28791 [Triticum urartu]
MLQGQKPVRSTTTSRSANPSPHLVCVNTTLRLRADIQLLLLLGRSWSHWRQKSLEFEKPRFDESRSLLRSGPASSLRINIRAVAQYASSNGQGKTASDAVDECLRALEDLDSLLLKASRKDSSASVEVMRSKIAVALGALDNLLQTVPSAVMDKGKAIADAYRTPSDGYYEEGNGAELDPSLKQLQDIL